MKKITGIIGVVVFFAILFYPYKKEVYKNEGAKIYNGLSYQYVEFNTPEGCTANSFSFGKTKRDYKYYHNKLCKKIEPKKDRIQENRSKVDYTEPEGIIDYIGTYAQGVDSVAICRLIAIHSSHITNASTKLGPPSVHSIGTMQIKKNLTGEVLDEKITTRIWGGIVEMSKYYNELGSEGYTKRYLTEKYTKDEMKKLFVKSGPFNVLEKLESRKDFLCYLRYNKETKNYRLTSKPENLREVTSYSKNSEEITIKDVKEGYSKKNTKEQKTRTFPNINSLDENLYHYYQ